MTAQPQTSAVSDPARLGAALARMQALLVEVSQGNPLICDQPLFASYEFAADFKIVVEAASARATGGAG